MDINENQQTQSIEHPEDQHFNAQTTEGHQTEEAEMPNGDSLFVPEVEEPTIKEELPIDPWKIKKGEQINLLSDDEGHDDIISAFATNGPPFKPQLKETSPRQDSPVRDGPENDIGMQQPSKESAPQNPIVSNEMLRKQMLEKQRQMANKFRTQKAMDVVPTQFDDTANGNYNPGQAHREANGGNGKKSQSKDSERTKFEKLQQKYLRKKRAHGLSIDEEIEFIQLESREGTRLRKMEQEEAYRRAEAPSSDRDEGVDMSDPAQDADVFRVHEPEPPKKRGRKRTLDEHGEDEPPRKRTKGKVGSGRAKKATGTRYTSNDGEDDTINDQHRASKTGPKPKSKAKQKKGPISNMANVNNLMGTDVFADTARTAHLADQPTFEKTGPRGQRQAALRDLLASCPTTGDKKVKGDDMRLLKQCIKSFTGSESGSIAPADGGNWSLKGLKATLRVHQVLGTGFMRDRENSTCKPKGGIMADMMGLGKTVMTLANIVNGKPEKSKKHRTTLIVASPAILTQWFHEIAKHCYVDNTHPHGLGSVLQWRSGHRPISSDPIKMFMDQDIVLTTYNEVAKSFPKDDIDSDITDPEEKATKLKENFEASKGLLHSVQFLRVVLDEGQMIKNHRSHVSKACRALQAKHYWVLTGTPVMNTPLEFFPYFDLIREPAAGDYELFKRNFSDSTKGRERLNALLQKVMCRRTYLDELFGAKLLTLPMPTELTHWIQFNEIERKVYKIVESRFISRINSISREGQLDKKYNHIFTMLLRLRQICSHVLMIQGTIFDLLEREDFEELNHLTADEEKLSSEGASLIYALRKAAKAHVEAKAEGDHEIGQNVIEMETTPIDVLPFGQIEGEYGQSHGLTYRFRKYLKTLRKSEQWDAIVERSLCCACHQKPYDPYVTDCWHIYCKEHLEDISRYAAMQGKDQAACTECGTYFTSSNKCINMDDFKVRQGTTSSVRDTPEVNSSTGSKKSKKAAGEIPNWVDLDGEVLPSAKTIAVKSQVLEWLSENPQPKIVIYTQFLEMVKILAKVCAAEQWGYCTYIGTMDVDAREKALIDFGKEEDKNILLASLKSGGVGLNLTMATRVINIDPWWNSATEQQAFCRVFRIGQAFPTKMTRFVVAGTVEARMQEVKERKQIEIDDVLSTHQKQERLEIKDLLRLFGEVDEDDDDTPFIYPKDDKRFELEE